MAQVTCLNVVSACDNRARFEVVTNKLGYLPRGVDNAARIVTQKMAENLKQQIVLENQPGAAGLIGALIFANFINYTTMPADLNALVASIGR